MAHFGHGTHLVVSHGVHDDGGATNTVAFIADFLVADAVERTGRLVHVVLHAISRHIGGFGFFNGQTQARVHGRVTTTLAGRHRDFTDDTGPDLAALLVLTPFAVLNIGPFAMSCHG